MDCNVACFANGLSFSSSQDSDIDEDMPTECMRKVNTLAKVLINLEGSPNSSEAQRRIKTLFNNLREEHFTMRPEPAEKRFGFPSVYVVER